MELVKLFFEILLNPVIWIGFGLFFWVVVSTPGIKFKQVIGILLGIFLLCYGVCSQSQRCFQRPFKEAMSSLELPSNSRIIKGRFSMISTKKGKIFAIKPQKGSLECK